MAVFDEILKIAQEFHTIFILSAEAGVSTFMACRPYRVHFDQQGVMVAVLLYRHYVQEVAALLALGPKPIFSAAKKRHFTGLHRFEIRFFIHETEHQDILGSVVLNDGRYQAPEFTIV